MDNKTNKDKKAKIGGDIKFNVTIRNWIHQGFFYLDKTEMFYRLIWELIPFTFFIYILNPIGNLNWICSMLLSGFISHTLNWIFNDNFWTCIMFTFPKILNPGEKLTIEYLSHLQNRTNNNESISGCMIYGSLSRGEWHIKSDLDIRILRNPGLLNGFIAYFFVFKERIIAVFKKQPLDIYLADSVCFLRKLRSDEFPIFIKNNDVRLKEEYKTKKFTDFSKVTNLNLIR
jgi:predicted nucleotidyltransferase